MTFLEIWNLLKDNDNIVIGIIIVILSLFEIPKNDKCKIHPISSLFKWIGTQINSKLEKDIKDLNDKVEGLENSINEIDDKINKNSMEDAKNHALDCRREIILFADKVCFNSIKTKDGSYTYKPFCSEERFNDVILYMDEYENYCALHPDFKNNKAVTSCKIIHEAYDVCVREHIFLDKHRDGQNYEI